MDGRAVPDRETLLGSVAAPFDAVRGCFTPDRLDPDASPEEVPPAEGVLQVRGAWDPGGPVAIRAEWEH